MTTLVTGATGNTGRHVVAELLRRGQGVRALTRDPVAAARLLPAGAEMVAGTHTEPERLDDALRGVSRLHITVTAGLAEVGPELVRRAVGAGVAAAALLDDGHAGRAYHLTGYEALTPRERITLLSEAVERKIDFVAITHEQAVERLTATGVSRADAEYVVGWYARPTEDSTTVVDTVQRVTGRTPRTFAQWVNDHAERFRSPR
ncbi:NmrA family NAD(P)-binding protein [Streptomyces sp. NPDC127106]|uniref:NmrA family NAD(P)-binding protein n=1 Tax=Streptomyces sp. NPDC127106 TaxID=3345360 RepID=UPI00363FC7AD